MASNALCPNFISSCLPGIFDLQKRVLTEQQTRTQSKVSASSYGSEQKTNGEAVIHANVPAKQNALLVCRARMMRSEVSRVSRFAGKERREEPRILVPQESTYLNL